MLSRLFLAAGVAALAIAAPASAKPGGGHGGQENKGGQQQAAPGGGGGGGKTHGNRGGGGGGGGQKAVFQGGGGGHGHGGGGGFAAPQQQRVERQQSRGFERQQMRNVERQRGFERQQARQQSRNFERQRGFERQQARNVERQRGFERQQARQQARNIERQRGFERQQAKALERQQPGTRFAQRDALRNERLNRIQRQAAMNNVANVEQVRGFRNAQTSFVDDVAVVRSRGLIDGCPPGLWMKNNGCMPPGQAAKLLGVPFTAAAGIVPLYELPRSVAYLYPNTPDYYYRYGDGYLYRVNRGDNLIAALLPLIGGGYIPGQYLPRPYMASYVPSYYGLNSFYPDYGDDCHRYYGGVIYEVDCYTGLVEDVIPMYAGGYGVGQLIPSAYNYYNVPMQYRTLYYDTPDYGYWYSPGAIYQYDQRTSMITSVASLLSPGFTIGQPLPAGYGVYNVPYDYRATYYDTPNAWYRYNNGYIYQVDPVTQLVTAIVASLLT